MKNIIELKQEEKKSILEKFIECFVTGQDFEKFLGIFLQKIGFEEVVVTRATKDGGIDLTAIRKGFDKLGSDTNNYYIQAKKYKLSNKINRGEVSQLRGSVKKDRQGNIIPNNQVINIFITTTTFTDTAREEAEDDVSRPVVLIDGYSLVDLCIQHGIGFDFKPMFNDGYIKEAISSKQKAKDCAANNGTTEKYDVEKVISVNDVRARILPLPQMIKAAVLEEGLDILNLSINGNRHILNIDKSKRYLGGVTEIYKNLNMIKQDGVLESRVGKWLIKDGRIYLFIENSKREGDD